MSSDSDGSEWLERPDHPLMNNVILDLVFERLRKKELKECRLVCKTWSELTIPHTHKSFEITIHGNNPTKLHTTQNFVDVFRSNILGIPFARFHLDSFPTTNEVGTEFLKLCGDTMSAIRFLGEDHMLQNVTELLKSTPALKVFEMPRSLHSLTGKAVKLFPDGLENSKSKLTSLKTLIVPGEYPKDRKKSCPTFLEELITAAQNISCLHLSKSSLTTSFEVLSLIENMGREASIQDLRISLVSEGKSESDLAKLLLRMTAKPNGMKLRRFFYNSYRSDEGNLARRLIPHLKDNLERLHLHLHVRPRFIELPRMPRLTNISLAGPPNDFNLQYLDLNENFPVLHELKLYKISGPPIDEFFPYSAPCPNISALQVQSLSGLTINGFNQMLAALPNLMKLNIQIKVDGSMILRQIWSQMTQLKSLVIVGQMLLTGDSLDSVLTGISAHALQQMRVVIQSLAKMANAVERRAIILELRSQHSQLPSISNLKSLSSFSLNLSGEMQGVRILTDLSGYLGLYAMNHLKHLKLENCEMTKTCCEVLRQDLGLESSVFKNWEKKTIIPSEENN